MVYIQSTKLDSLRLFSLVDIYVDQGWNIVSSFNLVVLVIFVGVILLGTVVWRWYRHKPLFRSSLELEKVTIGLGNHNVTIRPNNQDRQIAYKLWVELYTRKIGLPIDLEHDVIYEVYNSWYEFFKITRELIKEIPVSKIRKSQSTQKIIDLSIEVLNLGLRPHLTQWQSRFRQWYEKEIDTTTAKEAALTEPQEVQKSFPNYDQLKEDLLKVNKKLVWYRESLEDLWRS